MSHQITPTQAAKSLIEREIDACRKPNVRHIVEATGVQPSTVDALVDEVRAERANRPKSPPRGPSAATKPATVGGPGPKVRQDWAGWLSHPEAKVRRAAERACKAIEDLAAMAVEDPEIVELRRRKAALEAELAEVNAALKAPCKVCGGPVGREQSAVAGHANSARHRAAIAAAAQTSEVSAA